MAPNRVNEGRPSGLATTEVPALTHTRRARRKAARLPNSVGGGVRVDVVVAVAVGLDDMMIR